MCFHISPHFCAFKSSSISAYFDKRTFFPFTFSTSLSSLASNHLEYFANSLTMPRKASPNISILYSISSIHRMLLSCACVSLKNADKCVSVFPSKNMLLRACWASSNIFAGNKWKITGGSAINQSSLTIFFGLFTAQYRASYSPFIGKREANLFPIHPNSSNSRNMFSGGLIECFVNLPIIWWNSRE